MKRKMAYIYAIILAIALIIIAPLSIIIMIMKGQGF